MNNQQDEVEVSGRNSGSKKRSDRKATPAISGKINFVEIPENATRDRTVPYVIVSKDTSYGTTEERHSQHRNKTAINTWKNMLKVEWSLRSPRLVISFTIGSNGFVMKPRQRVAFKKAVMETASRIDTWFITEGTSEGVTRLVGEAVGDDAVTGGIQGHTTPRITTLGITPLAVVHYDTSSEKSTTDWRYPVRDFRRKAALAAQKVDDDSRLEALEHNHTHFIFVDQSKNTDALSDFRSRLEKHISKQCVDGSEQEQSVTVILVVLQGGTEAMQQVKTAAKQNSPILIFEGTGGLADVIAEAYHQVKSVDIKNADEWEELSKNLLPLVTSLLSSTYTVSGSADDREAKIKYFMDDLRSILAKPFMINIVNLNDQNPSQITEAILTAIMRAKHESPLSGLILYLSWNQPVMSPAAVDMAWSYCRTAHAQRLLTVGEWQAMFCEALRKDRWDFASMLWEFGIDVSEIQDQLNKVYIETFQDSESLTSDILKLLIHTEDIIIGDVRGSQTVKELCFVLVDYHSKSVSDDTLTPDITLLAWAVLLNRRELARLFWIKTNDPIGSALLSCALLNKLSIVAEKAGETGLKNDLLDHATEFEQRAIDVLSEMYRQDKEMALRSLDRKTTLWDVRTKHLSIAYYHQLREFVVQTCCQKQFDNIWYGCVPVNTTSKRVVTISSKRAFLSTLFCILFPFLLLFRCIERFILVDNKKSPLACCACSFLNCGKICWFYATPMTRFFIDMVIYMSVLVCFTLFMVWPLKPGWENVSAVEWYVIGWMGLHILEEIRVWSLAWLVSQRTAQFNFRFLLSDLGNLLDIVTYLLFIAAVITRMLLPEVQFTTARVLYSITIIASFLRMFHIFLLQRTLGPKVLMIIRMLKDLFVFMVILAVFLIGWGVAYHANLHPNSGLSWQIVYYPYWQIYGELFNEELEGKSDAPSCQSVEGLVSDPNAELCSEQTWLVPVLSAIYLVFTNLLLVNLVIAMFSHTFHTVQESSEKLWKFHMYWTIHKYRARVPPPFNAIYYVAFLVVRLTKCLLNCSDCQGQEAPVSPSSQAEKEDLRRFEKVAAETVYIVMQQDVAVKSDGDQQLERQKS